MRQELDRTRLLYYREGRGSTVSAYELLDRRILAINGRTVAGDVLTDLHHEYLLGHLPVMLHPNPKSAVVIGLGAGITLGGVVAHPGLDHIVLVEIEPAVFGGAALFDDVNDDALHDRRLQVVYQDGRNYLLTTPEHFDVVTADPIHPWAQGSAYLYTTEYYQTIAQHLNPSGVMCQWVPLYDLSKADLRSIAASFCASFTHTTLWLASYDAVLIGSNAPLQVDLNDWARRLAAPTVKHQLGRIGLDDPLSLLAELCMDDAALRRFSQGGLINTDDNLHIEFSSPLSLREVNWLPNVKEVNSCRTSPRGLVPGATASFDTTISRYLQAKIETLNASILTLGDIKGSTEAVSRLQATVHALPGYGLGRRYLSFALLQVAASQGDLGHWEEAARICQQALATCPDDAEGHRLLGQALHKMHHVDEAIPEYRESLRLRPRHVGTRGELSAALSQAEHEEEAAQVLREGLKIYPDDVELTTRLAWMLATSKSAGLRNGAEAVRLAERALRLPIAPGREANSLAALAAGLAEQGHMDQALRTARRALRLAESHGQRSLADLLKTCVTAFEAGHPLHQG